MRSFAKNELKNYRLLLLAIFLLGTAIVSDHSAFADNPSVAASDSSATASSSKETPKEASKETPPVSAASDASSTSSNTASAETSSATQEVGASQTPGNVTVDFKDADIQNVLRILSFKSGVNIVAGKDVTGTVTIRLVDVPWEKALDVVLKTYGYAYDRDGSIIRVTTLENLKKEELSTEVFTLNYSQAGEVEKSIKDVLSERGKIRSDLRSNTLIVTDMPTTLQNVKLVVSRLDKITPQVSIQSKVIETTLGNADKLGIKWNVLASVNGSARPDTFPFSARQSTAISRFMPEGRAPTTTNTFDSTGALVASSTVSDFPVKAPGSVPNFPVADKKDFIFGTLDFTQFSAILQMLQQRDNTKVLSEPHVTTLNNKEAKILVGEVIAIPTFERNSTTGKMEITGYKDKDLGIRLAVTPQINDQNEIVVTLHPEITNLLGYDDLTADIKAPRFSTREAETQVRIKNGQTIVIGGLIKEDAIDSTTKVPILGDLPLLGKLFNFKDKSVTKTDLLFFVTVNIMDEKAAAPQGHPA